MLKKSELIILISVLAIITISTSIYWMKSDSLNPSNAISSPQQVSSSDNKKAALEAIVKTTNLNALSGRCDKDNTLNLVKPQANQNSSIAQDTTPEPLGWRPNVKRYASPETLTKINKIVEDAIALLGYKKISALKIKREYRIIRQHDPDSSEKLLEVGIVYELYDQPNWVRREIYRGEDEQPTMIEVVTEKLVIQKTADAKQVGNVKVLELPWYNYTNHPLMLYHELNPLIYESCDFRKLSAQDANAIGADDAKGHRFAILKTPHDSSRKDLELWCETWIDLENGHVLKNAMYDHDKIKVQTQNYIYKEVSEGIFCPVARKTIFFDDVIKRIFEEKVVNIEINVPVDKEIPLIFQHN